MKICLFGCGSLGANTAINIARRLGSAAEFVLIDYDSIEAVNLANQPWFDVNIGQKKATVLCSILYRIHGVVSKKIIRKVTDAKAFVLEHKTALSDIDLFVDCFDNMLSRKLTQAISDAMKTPIIHAGFDESIFLVDWGTAFPLTDTGVVREPVCDRRDLATLVVLGAGLTEYVVSRYHKTGRQHRKLLELHHDILQLW